MSRFTPRERDEKRRRHPSASPAAAANGDASPRRPRAGKSVYQDRFPATGPITTVMTVTGKFLGIERGGVFEPAKPCCADARDCHRPECWTTIGELSQ